MCDLGAANGTARSCCDGACQLRGLGYTCPAASGECGVAQTCDGVSPNCPADVFAPATQPCSGGQCDGAGVCGHLPGPAGTAIAILDAFDGNATPLTMADGWAPSDEAKAGFDERSGVATPTSHGATRAMSWGTPYAADQRFKVTLHHGGTFSKFALYVRLQDPHDLTSDHYRVEVTPGTSVPPAFADPDTLTLIKRVNGIETTITPTNTANGVPDDYPSIVGDHISLRHRRVANGDTFEIMVINDQVMFRVNNIIRMHEAVTGVDAAGHVGLINYGGVGDNTYDTAKGATLIGRYVAGTGHDQASGLDNAPWKTLDKAIADQAAGEIAIVTAGTYTKSLAMRDGGVVNLMHGTPRTPTSFEDPVMWIAKAGDTVTQKAGTPLLTNLAAVRYLYSYGIHYTTTSPSRQPVIKFGVWRSESSWPHMIQGGSIKDAIGQGVLVAGNDESRYEGGHWFIDVLIKGNGRDDGGYSHNMYMGTKNLTIEYCTADGHSDRPGRTQGQGFNIYVRASKTPTYTSGSQVLYSVTKNHLPDPGSQGGYGLLFARGTGNRAVGVRSYNNHYGLGVGYFSQDTMLINCEVYNNTVTGIRLGVWAGSVIDGTKVYNSTVTGNARGIEVGVGSTTATHTQIKNTIVYGNTLSDLRGEDYTEATNWKTLPNDDPVFTDPEKADHRLRPISGAKTGGTDLSSEMDAIDRLGHPRVGPWSRGCFE